MKFEKTLLLRTILNITLYVSVIILPTIIWPDAPLVYQVSGVIFAVLFFSLWQYRTISKTFSNLLIRFGYKSDRIKLSDMVEKMEDVFEQSQHTSELYSKMNQSLRLAIEINNLFLKTNDQQSVYDFILEKALEAVGKSSKGSIMLLNTNDELSVISLIGFDESFKDLKIKKEDDFLYVLTNGTLDRSVIVDDVVNFNKAGMTEAEFNSFYEKHPKVFQTTLSAPIQVDDNFIGVINMDSHEKDAFTNEDLFIMDLFASQLEVAIRNRNLLDEILYLSRFDHLTRVYNRKYFDDVLESLIKKDSKFIYTIIDINNLKRVNDVFGHTEGDRLLRIFCDTVSKNIRNSDYFARLGGDEFALILTDLSKVEVSKIFLRIMKELEQYVLNHNLHYSINFSYGITEYPNEAKTSDELYLVSDEKMYKMKRSFNSIDYENNNKDK